MSDRAVAVWSKKASYSTTGANYTFAPYKSYDRWDLRFINNSANTMTWTIEALDADGDSVPITDGGSAYTTATNTGLDITIQSTHIKSVKITVTGTAPSCVVKCNAYRDVGAVFDDYGTQAVASA